MQMHMLRQTEQCINAYIDQHLLKFVDILGKTADIYLTNEMAEETVELLYAFKKVLQDQPIEFVSGYKTMVVAGEGFGKEDVTDSSEAYLSLVKEEDMEEIMSMAAITEHAKRALVSRTEAVALMLKRIEGDDIPEEFIAMIKRATDPVHLLDILRKHLKKFNLPIQMRLLAYRDFDANVIKSMDQLYGCVLQIGEENELIQQQENPLSGKFTWASILKAHNATTTVAAAASSSVEMAGAATVKGGAAVPPVSSGQWSSEQALPSHQLSAEQFGSDLMSRMLMRFLQSDNGEANSPEQLEANSQAVKSALASMPAVDETSDPLQIEDLLQRINDKLDQEDQSVSSIDNRVMEFVCELFRSVSDNRDISGEIRAEILRLQIPVIHAGLQDIRVLNDSKHPVAQLINVMAQSGIGVSGKEDKIILSTIHDQVNLVSDRYMEDLSVFDEAAKKLSETWSAIRAEAEEKEQIHAAIEAKKSRIKRSKQFIANVLKTQLKDKKIPVAVKNLMIKYVAPVMLQRYVKEGEAGGWRLILEQAVRLVDLTKHGQDDLMFARQYSLLGNALEEIGRCLQNEKIDSEEVAGYIQEIKADAEKRYEALGDVRNQVSGTDTVEINVEDIRAELNITIQSKSEEQLSLYRHVSELPDYVVPGRWFRVYIEGRELPRRLRLLSILQDTDELVFVNYQGERKATKSAVDFIAELNDERSQIIKEDLVFDSALEKVIGSFSQVH